MTQIARIYSKFNRHQHTGRIGEEKPNPLPGACAVWAYRVIYRVGNQQTGQWSNTVRVPVGG